MGLVESWLEGIGLGYAVPIFAGQGITSPDMLSELDVVDFPELGISDHNDRKKLFYLIQRVRLALARGRGTDGKEAPPQVDSTAAPSSSTPTTINSNAINTNTAAAQQQEREEKPAPGATHSASSAAVARESRPDNAAAASVRFRRELEVPVARDAMAPPRAATSEPGGGGGGPAGRSQHTPVKVQRLPPSHRRPKTPHLDGTARSRPSPAAAKTPVLGGDGRKRQSDRPAAVEKTRQSPAPAPPAAVEGVAAVTATGPAKDDRVYPRHRQGGGNRAPATSLRHKRSYAEKRGKLSEKRSVLEPVQLDEAGGRADASAARDLPPPPPPQDPATRACGEQAPSTVGSGSLASREEPGNWRAASSAYTVEEEPLARRPDDEPSRNFAEPPLLPNTGRGLAGAAAEITWNGAEATGSHGGGGGASTFAGATPSTAPPLGRIQEVARLRPAKRAIGAGGGGVTQDRIETSANELPRLDEEDSGEDCESEDEAAAVNAHGLATDLISAHREDVRSALAAARKDMDLVSRADKDRHPAALLEYAREVEGVLGTRLAAGAKLRAALDSYVARRKASSRSVPEENGLRGRIGGRSGRPLQA